MSLLKTIFRPLLKIGPLRRWREAFRENYETRIRPRHYKRAKTLGVTSIKRQPQLVVSLTSIPSRISTVHNTLHSLLQQAIKPDKLILWLGEDQFPNKEGDLPEELLSLRKLGLTIGWCQDIGPATKLVPSLKEFPNSLIVTADDDCYYPPKWLQALHDIYQKEPHYIHCHRVDRIKLDAHGDILPYLEWGWHEEIRGASYLNIPLGFYGVLYFPGCLHADVLDHKILSQLTPRNDDIWFWAMALMRGTKIKMIQENRQQVLVFKETQHTKLWPMNARGGGNDEQMARVLAHYPQLGKLLVTTSVPRKLDGSEKLPLSHHPINTEPPSPGI